MFCLQVQMMSGGVVDALLATLVAVQGAGAHALPVQEAACWTLQNLARAVDNQVVWVVSLPGIHGDGVRALAYVRG